MGYRYNHEAYLIDRALDEIECDLLEFDSELPGDYIDWELDVNRCIDGFPLSSFCLGAIIGRKLVGQIGVWWRVHIMRRKMNGYGDRVSWDYMKGVLREKLVPPYYQDRLYENLLLLRQGNMSVKE